MLGISNLRQEKFKFFRGGLPLPRAFLVYDAIILYKYRATTFFFFLFVSSKIILTCRVT